MTVASSCGLYMTGRVHQGQVSTLGDPGELAPTNRMVR